MDDQGGYAPRSPDLSAYHSGPDPSSLQSPSQQTYQPPPSSFPAYQPPQPGVVGAYQSNYYGAPPPPPSAQPQYLPPQAAGFGYHPGMPAGSSGPGLGMGLGGPAYGAAQHPHPSYPSHQLAPQAPHLQDHAAPQMNEAPAGPGRPRGRKPKKLKPEEPDDEGLPPAPGVVEGIEVKTKFPVARIKRIMQADEDVGKVAQVTPTAVSKALELFMISLVTKSAAQARLKSAKKVTAAHLKHVIQSDESFDFLTEIVSKVPEAASSKKEVKGEDSDEGETKKRRGRGKRKTEEEDW